jgi:hypothetical protein
MTTTITRGQLPTITELLEFSDAYRSHDDWIVLADAADACPPRVARAGSPDIVTLVVPTFLARPFYRGQSMI